MFSSSSRSAARRRLGAAARTLPLALVALAAAACHDDSTSPTSPTPVASSLTMVSGNAQSDTVAATLPSALVVQVKDQNGAAMANVAVTWTVSSGGGTLANASGVTDAAGQASASWTLGTTAGTDTVTASVSGLASVVFVATATAGAAAKLAIVSGDGQTAASGAALANPLIVRATDQYGNAVSGATVTWTAAADGVLASATTTTDASGLASTAFTFGPTTGAQTVTATLAAASPVSVTFTETAS